MTTLQTGRFQKCAVVDLNDLEDAVILSNRSTDLMFGANRVGRRIVQLLEQPQTTEGLVTVLTQEFEVSDDQCRQQLEQFLAQLAENELIESC